MAQAKPSFIQKAANGALYAPLAALVVTALISKAEEIPHLQVTLKVLSVVLALAGLVLGAGAIIMARPFRLLNNGIGGLALSAVVMAVLLYFYIPQATAARMVDRAVGHWRSVSVNSAGEQTELTLNGDGSFTLGVYPSNPSIPSIGGRWKFMNLNRDLQLKFDAPQADPTKSMIAQGKQVDEQTITLPTKNGGEQTYRRAP